jgi:hypothetical protein
MAAFFRKLLDRLNLVLGVGPVDTLLYELRAGDPLGELPWSEGVSVEQVAPASIDALACASGGIDLAMVDSRLRAGETCYVARVNGRLAHYSWVKTSGAQPIIEAAVEYAVGPGEFWIYHCWTEHWARGMRIYPSVLAMITRDYFEKGFTRARIYTTFKNVPSQKGIARVGFRQISRMRAFRIGRHYFRLG